jgi:hypothetical protein
MCNHCRNAVIQGAVGEGMRWGFPPPPNAGAYHATNVRIPAGGAKDHEQKFSLHRPPSAASVSSAR